MDVGIKGNFDGIFVYLFIFVSSQKRREVSEEPYIYKLDPQKVHSDSFHFYPITIIHDDTWNNVIEIHTYIHIYIERERETDWVEEEHVMWGCPSDKV